MPPALLDFLTITLPEFPPSTNHIWRAGGGGVHCSKDYACWRQFCALTLGKQQPVRTPCRVLILLTGGKGFSDSMDVDNRIKATLDLIKAIGVIPQDSAFHVPEVTARYLRPETGGKLARCVVEVRSI